MGEPSTGPRDDHRNSAQGAYAATPRTRLQPLRLSDVIGAPARVKRMACRGHTGCRANERPQTRPASDLRGRHAVELVELAGAP
jgi:hypothetical protein